METIIVSQLSIIAIVVVTMYALIKLSYQDKPKENK